MTIIISSHILGELSKVATRYGIIRDGQMIEEISAKELDEKCRAYLSLKVDDVTRAIPILENELFITDYAVHENNEIWVYDEIESAKVNETLSNHNISISQMFYQKKDLESYFLEKIGGSDNV